MTHPSHTTRFSDSSVYDEVCTACRATDEPGSNLLELPCAAVDKKAYIEALRQKYAKKLDELRLRALREGMPKKNVALMMIDAASIAIAESLQEMKE